MSFIQSLGTIFLIILTGIICRKMKILNQTHVEGFEIILFKILTPCYLFSSIIERDLKTLLYLPYACSYLLSFVFVAIITFLIFNKDDSSFVYIKILASSYTNTAIYSLPVITFLLENPLSAILSNLLQVIIIQSVFLILIGFTTNKKESVIIRLKSLILTPLIIMPILGLLYNYLQISISPLIFQPISTFGNGASSIALFTFGLMVGGISFTRNDINKHLILIVVIKNIAHPIIAYAVGKYIFQLSSYWLTSLVIVTSAPTAFIVYLIAKQFSIDQELVKKVVALSSIASLFSLTLIIFCS